jgi:hypothetical protein
MINHELHGDNSSGGANDDEDDDDTRSKLIHGLLEKLTAPPYSKSSPYFKEPEGSLPRLEEPATCLYPEPDQSSQCPLPHPTS